MSNMIRNDQLSNEPIWNRLGVVPITDKIESIKITLRLGNNNVTKLNRNTRYSNITVGKQKASTEGKIFHY